MRRFVSLCFVILAICAVVYGLVLKYSSSKQMPNGYSSAPQTVDEIIVNPEADRVINDVSIPLD